jgi:hypothetical protein
MRRNIEMSNRHRKPRRLLAAAGLTTIAVGAGIACAPAACAATRSPADGSGEDGSAAIVTPSIRIMKWFGTVGFGEGCNFTLSLVGAGADYFQQVPTFSPFIAQGVSQCATFQTQDGTTADQGIAASQPLAAINPAVNPGVAAASDGATKLGTEQHDSVAPFGPTIVGFGRDIAFFGGS